MADKYVRLSNGGFAETEAKVTSAGAGDAGKIPALDASGKLDSSMLPAASGGDESLRVIVAGEGLSAGDLVNIYDNAGTANVRKADASNNRPAHGFVESAYITSQSANVYLWGINPGVSGLTSGSKLFLSASVPGDVTATAPSTAGHIVQDVGYALSATEMRFVFSIPVTLA